MRHPILFYLGRVDVGWAIEEKEGGVQSRPVGPTARAASFPLHQLSRGPRVEWYRVSQIRQRILLGNYPPHLKPMPFKQAQSN